jgi:hypothetical protein
LRECSALRCRWCVRLSAQYCKGGGREGRQCNNSVQGV